MPEISVPTPLLTGVKSKDIRLCDCDGMFPNCNDILSALYTFLTVPLTPVTVVSGTPRNRVMSLPTEG